MSKQDIRHSIRTVLSVISSEEKRSQSEEVFNKLKKNKAFIESKRIGIYVNLRREIQTKQIIEFCFENKKQVFIPKYCEKSLEMDFFELFSMKDLEGLPQTKWKIKQPEDVSGREKALSGGGLNVILVPGVAFTSNGLRLGNGLGFYDRYLNKCLNNCRPLLIGLAFKQQILDTIPTEKHDFKLDFVLFP